MLGGVFVVDPLPPVVLVIVPGGEPPVVAVCQPVQQLHLLILRAMVVTVAVGVESLNYKRVLGP